MNGENGSLSLFQTGSSTVYQMLSSKLVPYTGDDMAITYGCGITALS